MILDDLFQEIILDHYKNPRNLGNIENKDIHEHVKNPFCGDEVDIDIKFDADQKKIDDIKFNGEGCSLSMASASMLTEILKGKPLEEVKELIEIFKRMVKGQSTPEEEDKLGELQAFKGVSKFPIRVKCTTLVWNSVQNGLKKIDPAGNHSEKKEG